MTHDISVVHSIALYFVLDRKSEEAASHMQGDSPSLQHPTKLCATKIADGPLDTLSWSNPHDCTRLILQFKTCRIDS